VAEHTHAGEPEFTHDLDEPMDDYERDHWKEQTRPQAEAGNAMAVLLQRMFATYTTMERLLVNYSIIMDQGAMLALDAQESMFVRGARWAAETENGVAWASPDNAEEAAKAWWEVLRSDEARERGTPPPEVGDVHVRRARATFALAVHSRAMVALAMIVDRHRLQPDDEGAAVLEAFHPSGGGYEAEIAEQALGLFLEDLDRRMLMFADRGDLVGFDDERVLAARAGTVAEIQEGAAQTLALAWERSAR